jgi:hypothetical protein
MQLDCHHGGEGVFLAKAVSRAHDRSSDPQQHGQSLMRDSRETGSVRDVAKSVHADGQPVASAGLTSGPLTGCSAASTGEGVAPAAASNATAVATVFSIAADSSHHERGLQSGRPDKAGGMHGASTELALWC